MIFVQTTVLRTTVFVKFTKRTVCTMGVTWFWTRHAIYGKNKRIAFNCALKKKSRFKEKYQKKKSIFKNNYVDVRGARDFSANWFFVGKYCTCKVYSFALTRLTFSRKSVGLGIRTVRSIGPSVEFGKYRGTFFFFLKVSWKIWRFLRNDATLSFGRVLFSRGASESLAKETNG